MYEVTREDYRIRNENIRGSRVEVSTIVEKL